MNSFRKIALLAGGYAAAFFLASAIVAIRVAATSGLNFDPDVTWR